MINIFTMEVESYNQELIYANTLFKRLFNNITITQNNKKIKFKCLLGNRSRIFKNLENAEKNAEYELPMIIIERNGITKNDERLANVNNEVKYAQTAGRFNYNIYTPVPIDISYTVTIVSKYQDQVDRAVSNFIPFFNKDLYVRCQHPKFEGIEFTNQVIMDNSINEEVLSEIDSSQDDIKIATIGFTYKTYMFCGSEQSKIKHSQTSVVLSNVLSTIVYELTEDDKKNHISDFIDKSLSTTITTEVTIPVEIEVSAEDQPSGFVPVVNKIYVGFYPIPLISSYIPRMNWVDSLDQTVVPISGYMGNDPETGKEIYEPVTTSACYYPYVDKLTWTIDATSDED